jgi:hypothetical protein
MSKDTSIYNIQIGETITFGKYEGEPMEWIALDKKEESALLFSKKIINFLPFMENADIETTDIEWASSSIRTWLNNEFLPAAFSEDEKESILTTTVENNAYPDDMFKIEDGVSTEDKVFLPSIEEAQKLMDVDIDSYFECEISEYAHEKMLEYYANLYGEDEAEDYVDKDWLLRTSCTFEEKYYPCIVSGSDISSKRADITAHAPCGVRPAIWVKGK